MGSTRLMTLAVLCQCQSRSVDRGHETHRTTFHATAVPCPHRAFASASGACTPRYIQDSERAVRLFSFEAAASSLRVPSLFHSRSVVTARWTSRTAKTRSKRTDAQRRRCGYKERPSLSSARILCSAFPSPRQTRHSLHRTRLTSPCHPAEPPRTCGLGRKACQWHQARHARPTKGGKPPSGRYRRQMSRRLRTQRGRRESGDTQRWQVETVMSMIKRNLGEELSGQTNHSRNRQKRLLVVVHNCMILLLVWEVCDGAGEVHLGLLITIKLT